MGPICQNTNPFFNISTTPTCETEIFTKSSPYKCKIHLTINNYPPWTALTKHYGWIYATPTPQTINLNCPKNLQITIDIQNIGILQTKPEFEIKSINLPQPQSKNFIFLDKPITSVNTNVSISSAATYLKIHLKGIKNKIKTLLEIGEKEDIPPSFLNYEIFFSKQLETEKNPIFYINNINFTDYILIVIIIMILPIAVLLLKVSLRLRKLGIKLKQNKTKLKQNESENLKNAKTQLSNATVPLLDNLNFNFNNQL